jgi:hypothetical protein
VKKRKDQGTFAIKASGRRYAAAVRRHGDGAGGQERDVPKNIFRDNWANGAHFGIESTERKNRKIDGRKYFLVGEVVHAAVCAVTLAKHASANST